MAGLFIVVVRESAKPVRVRCGAWSLVSGGKEPGLIANIAGLKRAARQGVLLQEPWYVIHSTSAERERVA